MRQGSNSGRRPRGRTNRKQHGGGGGGGQPRTHTFDSNGPDGRVRGNARQVYEKYLSLARDATSAGDRIAAEAYYQYAEHYFRILSDSTDPTPSGRRPEDRQPQPFGFDDGDDGDDEDDAALNGAQQRQYDARNGNGAPHGNRDGGHREGGHRDHRDSGPRDSGPRDGGRRDSGPRESGPRDTGPRDSGPRDTGPRDSGPREASQRQPQTVSPEAVPAPRGEADAAPQAPRQADPQSQPQAQPAADESAPPRRRGRPRKPRPDDEAQQPDGSPETESGPVVS